MRSATRHDGSRPDGKVPGLAWFVTPHGFGHAARACAVMAACSSQDATIRHHIFTTVPRGFFDESLTDGGFSFHHLECDVGMVQSTPLDEDVDATVRALDRLPIDDDRAIERLADQVAAAGCRLVVCDIAPLGLAVAERLGVPGVLVENFTWDWIYRAYADHRLNRYGEVMSRLFNSSALRIQTEPVCRAADASVRVAPISRGRRRTTSEVRSSLGVPAGHRMVLISISGLCPNDLGRMSFRPPPETVLVVPAAAGRATHNGKIISLPAAGAPYHPDLVGASDLVIGKLGYSTVAEVHHSGTAFAYLRRPRFPESPILEAFVRSHIPSAPLLPNWLDSPATVDVVEHLLEIRSASAPRPNGALHTATMILGALQRQSQT